MTDIQKTPHLNAREIVLNVFPVLMMEKGYGKITVQDILKRANIGRTTFYTYFTSKEDVLKTSIDQLRDDLIESVKKESTQKTLIKQSKLKFTYHFFDHILSHHKLYDDIVGRDYFFIVERYFLRMLTYLIERELAITTNSNTQRIQLELMTQHLVGAIWATSIWALERKNLSASAIDEHFQKMAFTGLENTLKTL